MNRPGDIIRKYCLPEDSIEEAVKKIVEVHAEEFTLDDALDIMVAAAEEGAKHKDMKDWNMLNKIEWTVRLAYMCGVEYATNIMFHMIQMGAEDADQEAATA